MPFHRRMRRRFDWGRRRRCVHRDPRRPGWVRVDSSSDDEEEDLDVRGFIVCYGGRQRSRQQQRKPEPEQAVSDVLKVESVDCKVAENVKKHHTDEYDITEGPDAQLVVRRGQSFNVQIVFDRGYDIRKDDLRLVFEIGKSPLPSKGTQVEFVLSDKDEKGEWGAKVAKKSADNKTLTITVFTPPNCIVGKWRFKVKVVKRTNDKAVVFDYGDEDPIYIYLLFNPWCREDTVFMENDSDRAAYVLNETGKIYSGNTKRITPKPWVFGQFDGNVLECCMLLLRLSKLDFSVRGDPIRVVRKLTAMINAQDEGGVLTGNWSGDYSGGKSPLSWTGSAPILEQFYRERTPVRFGQCWVFSGVLTTVCRALGIPARSVTNFASAHDADTSITIDLHYDCDGNAMDNKDRDSVWNFHVWNEAWMARSDLQAGYGGWQACDATPQETSDGVYCCGPCPVLAVKMGEVSMSYDGPFIFAEVNADRVYWMQQDDGSWKNVYLEKNVIGKFISTLGKDNQRDDVTLCYKFPEGSPEERVAVRRANQVGSMRKDIYQSGPEDVKFELCTDSENTFVGDTLVVELHCKNTSKETRTINGSWKVKTMYYTGVEADVVGTERFHDVQLKAGEGRQLILKAKPEDYQQKLKDCCMMLVDAMVKVNETSQTFAKKDNTRLRKPHLTIKAVDTVKKDKEMEMAVSFQNPLTKTLTDCLLEVEGPGLGNPMKYSVGDVPPKGTFQTTIKLKLKKKGQKEIVAIFSSLQLEDINGSHCVKVQE